MQNLAITSKIKQTDNRTVFNWHMFEEFFKKFDKNERNSNYLYKQNTYNVPDTNTFKM